jgi:hypothetical protein
VQNFRNPIRRSCGSDALAELNIRPASRPAADGSLQKWLDELVSEAVVRDDDRELIAHLARSFQRSSALAASFEPRSFDGDLVFFRACRVRAGGIAGSPERWQPYVRGAISVHELECERSRMLDSVYRPAIARVISAECGTSSPATENTAKRSIDSPSVAATPRQG